MKKEILQEVMTKTCKKFCSFHKKSTYFLRNVIGIFRNFQSSFMLQCMEISQVFSKILSQKQLLPVPVSSTFQKL